jgi:hypothetical protein
VPRPITAVGSSPKGSALPHFCCLVLCEGFFGKFFGWEGFGCFVFCSSNPNLGGKKIPSIFGIKDLIIDQ